MSRTIKTGISAFAVALVLAFAALMTPAMQSTAYAEPGDDSKVYTSEVIFALTGTDTWETTYVGRPWQPDVILRVTNAADPSETKDLHVSDGFDVGYDNNVNASEEAEVWVEPSAELKQQYPGLQNTYSYFTIKPANIVSFTYPKWTPYTGAAQTPLPTTMTREAVKANNETAPVEVNLTKGTDYTISYTNNKVPGYANVTVVGKGNYTGTVKGQFGISRCRISACTLKLSKKTYGYDGKAKKPTVTVTNNGIKLKAGTDYTVTYSKNVKIGTAKVRITAKSNSKYYKSYKTLTFRIIPKTPKFTSVSSVAAGISLNWAKVKGVDGYQIYRTIPNANAKWTKIKTTSATGYVDKNVKNGTTYSYYLVAYKKKSDATYKSKASATKTVTNTVVGFKISSIKQYSNKLVISWTKLSGASNYFLYRRAEGSDTWVKLYKGLNTSYTDTTVVAGKTYDYKAYIQQNGTNTASNIVRAHLSDTKNYNLSVVKGGSTGYAGFKASWNATDSDDQYELRWSQGTDFSNYHYWHTANTSFTLDKPTYTKHGQVWYVKVRSYHYYKGKQVFGSWSSVVKITL